MSVVMAIKDKGRVIIGSDRQVSVGGNAEHNTTKIWAMPDMPDALMGSVGSLRAMQIVQYSALFDKNAIGEDGVSTAFVVASLVPCINASLKQNGVVVEATADSGCEMMPNSFLFAYGDKAWTIGSDFSVTEVDDFAAIGSGADVVRGALYATKGQNPFKRIVTGIEAAADSTLYVDTGVDIMMTETLDEDEDDLREAFGQKPRKKKAKPAV